VSTAKPLNPRHQRFVDEYLLDRNATAAYKRAGYKAKGNAAEVNANKLLRKTQVATAIAVAEQARSQRTTITQDRVLNELGLLSFSDLTHYVVDDNGDVELRAGAPDGAMRALQSIKRKIITRGTGENREVIREVEIKLWDKPGPLKLAGLHAGLKFVERHEHTGKDGKPIETRVTFGGRYRKADAANG
jgi:phage terminase small subunit